MTARFQRLLLIGLAVIAAGMTTARAGTAQINAWLIGAGRAQVIAGQPLRIGVEIAPAENSNEPVSIVARGDDWRRDVSVELSPDAGGSAVAAQANGAGGQKQITATAENPVSGLWWIPAATTEKLAPGKYSLRVRWSGAPTPEPLALEILPAATAQDPMERVLALAYDDVLGGRPEAAALRVDAVLTANADNIDLLTFRGLLCLSASDPVSAKACLVRAQALAASIEGVEPSVTLYELRRRLDAPDDATVSSAVGGGDASAIPAWSRPPESVFRSRELATASAISPAVAPTAASAANATSPAPTAVTNSASSTAEKITVPGSTASKPVSVGNAPTAPSSVIASTTPQAAKAELASYASVETGVIVPPADLAEASIRSESRGQWATGAKASSEYGSPGYAAMQAMGAPNVAEGGDNTSAWCPGSSAKGLQWIELTYSKPVHATEVRVRQSYNPGAVVKIEAIDTDGGTHLWWSGIDPARPPGALNAIAWFSVRVPRTAYRVATVRVTLDIDAVASWQEVDAVQLVGEE
ncbi:hypothetical protein CMV30_00655 [Nibricoccus aquaticus]|uniref:Pappalysin-1 SD scarf domain-containing protein n=1 Tax=Nibricoccus aquaticus TaxID=2576891 RepID=A0A290Q5Z8_9BACT|nr:hypothetical protein [Nibricoccus aquaticus]ATC62600.1 hypothetical protein CMV30_00655 [Nibricoccus aquaticus]